MGSYLTNKFFCLNCGHDGIPIARSRGRQKERFHRKKLYCPFCKNTVNHIECKTMEDIEIFKQNFEKGLYIDETKESLSYVRNNKRIIQVV